MTTAAVEPAEVSSIREGVFFTTPDPLPRGRHRLPREEVLARQRERLLIAMTELLAARGIGAVRPAEVARRAGVSLGAFYDCFSGSTACVFAGYDRFIGVLLERMLAVDETGKARATLVHDVLRAYLDTLRSDLVVARAYQVEIDALGVPARSRRRESLLLFAEHIRVVAERTDPDHAGPSRALPASAYVGMVYAARQLASDALDLEIAPDFERLGAELAVWLADTFRDG